MRKVIRVSCFFTKLLCAQLIAPIVKLTCPSLRNIWIISERGDDARDNGYFFYKYMKTRHPEQKIYYVISKDSADYEKIEALGSPIDYNSFKHYLYYSLSKVRISSNAWGGDLPFTDYFLKMPFLLGNRKKFICLQHGITKDYMPEFIASNIKIDILIAGASPEFEYMRDNFGHPENTVRYTGFSRFDNLHNIECKSQILVMPTFRKWIKSKEKGEEYFKKWNEFLNSEKINALLEKENLELVFYPHYMLQKYLNCFNTNSKRIHIASFADYDVQTLLKESKLLITDFSSVFFDFAYMEKPVIYYQFDRDRYIKEHYDFTKGYFSYDTMGFGPVVYDMESLIEKITDVANNNFTMENSYKNQVNTFFPLKDTKNNDRIYDAIMEIVNNQKN